MKAVVFTLGCKVNDVESGSIIRGLKDMGVISLVSVYIASK